MNDLTSFEIRADVRSGTGVENARIVQGERLVQFCEDVDNCEPNLELPFGPALMVFDDRPATHPTLATLDDKETFQIETFGPPGADLRDALQLVFDPSEAALIERICSEPVKSWQLDEIVDVDMPSVDTFSLETVHLDRHGKSCCLGVHFVVSPDWYVAVWHGPFDRSGELLDVDYRVLPGTRVQVGQTEIEGRGGPERFARFLQELCRHQEYMGEVYGACLAEWESEFFRAVGELDDDVERESLAAAQKKLVDLRGFLGKLDHAQRSLGRRALNQPGFPALVRKEALERCEDLAVVVRDLRRDTQSAYALLAGAAAEQQAKSIRSQDERSQRLSLLVALLGGFILWPSLVAGIYGADISGLPGQHENQGLLVMIGVSVLGAVVFGAWIFFGHRRK